MGARRCPYTKGTFRAVRWAEGRMWIICHTCQRYIELMITTDVAERQVSRTRFICTRCGGEGALANEDPVGRGYQLDPRDGLRARRRRVERPAPPEPAVDLNPYRDPTF